MKTEHIIDSFSYISTGITILLLLGMIQSEPILFQYFSFILKCVVGIVLMYKYNDFRERTPFTVVDRKLCFLAGTYIVLFTIGDKIKGYKTNIIQNGISPT